jgi:hypothetical protein
MSDGLFYLDTREPNLTADITAVTLASTYKALYPVSNFPVLGGHYFARPGKAMNIKLFGRITTAATPGNFQIAVFYGTGADANGVKLVETTATALTARPDEPQLGSRVRYRLPLDRLGRHFVWNRPLPDRRRRVTAHLLAPGTAPAVSGACDLTASLILSVQALRSGSTAETMQVHMLRITSLN